MVVATDYPFLDIFWTMLIFFAWVAWIWVAVVCLGDLYGRHDVSGWNKAAWTIFVIFLPFLGILTYIIVHNKDMAERRMAAVSAQKAEFDQYVRSVAPASGNGGAAGEVAKAKELLDSGTIDQAEFEQLKAKALAHA